MKCWAFYSSTIHRESILNRSDRDSILNIACSVYCFCPEMLSHIGFIDHGSGHFLQSPILSFYNSILLWSSRTREITGNTIFFEEFFKGSVLKFTTMITFDLYDFTLFFQIESECRNQRTLNESHPCVSRILPTSSDYNHLR